MKHITYPFDPALNAARSADVIVVGTGMGGATVGYALARQGFEVLFLEKGGWIEAGNLRPTPESPEERLRDGWWPQPVSHLRGDDRVERFIAPIGCAVGGSSIFYAAALERMDARDFEPLQTAHGMVSGWPIRYEDFEPYYSAAEALYRIVAEPDEVRDQRFSEWDRALLRTLQANGLKPQRLNVAVRYDAECKECLGRICGRDCKADARSACLKEALELPNCRLLDGCDVLRLEADAVRVNSVLAEYQGRELLLHAPVVVLAAGALHSPQILLRSSNEHWPTGLANRSDQVGRNLMFHTSDHYGVWSPTKLDRAARQKKALSVRDFYRRDGDRLGYVQSLGLDAGRGDIAGVVKNRLRRFGIHNELVLKLLAKIPADVAARLLGNASIIAAMTEDDPNPENRITLNPREPDGATCRYVIAGDLRRRADALFDAFKQSIRPWRALRLSARLEMNWGHPCGTCRFGDDPATSVLDQDCRTHDLANLYVVDASFMRRSGAVNPSLTIAANALRVADRIGSAWKPGSTGSDASRKGLGARRGLGALGSI
jgi:choline dehydrogenase-like flavoprotein